MITEDKEFENKVFEYCKRCYILYGCMYGNFVDLNDRAEFNRLEMAYGSRSNVWTEVTKYIHEDNRSDEFEFNEHFYERIKNE